MHLKNTSGNVAIELIIFFLLIATASWLSLGIFEASKIRNTINEIAYLAARQIATDPAQLQNWQSKTFIRSLEKDHNLRNLQITVDCKDKICNNGNSIQIFASASSMNSVFTFEMTSKSVAVSSRFSSD